MKTIAIHQIDVSVQDLAIFKAMLARKVSVRKASAFMILMAQPRPERN